MRAIDVYMELMVVRVRTQLHDLTVAVRHTQGTDQKVFKDFLTGLQGDE